jgi:hypothetical protein
MLTRFCMPIKYGTSSNNNNILSVLLLLHKIINMRIQDLNNSRHADPTTKYTGICRMHIE